jgi:hypothetical protein
MCSAANLTCVQNEPQTAEACDGLHNDCDGSGDPPRGAVDHRVAELAPSSRRRRPATGGSTYSTGSRRNSTAWFSSVST